VISQRIIERTRVQNNKQFVDDVQVKSLEGRAESSVLTNVSEALRLLQTLEVDANQSLGTDIDGEEGAEGVQTQHEPGQREAEELSPGHGDHMHLVQTAHNLSSKFREFRDFLHAGPQEADDAAVVVPYNERNKMMRRYLLQCKSDREHFETHSLASSSTTPRQAFKDRDLESLADEFSEYCTLSQNVHAHTRAKPEEQQPSAGTKDQKARRSGTSVSQNSDTPNQHAQQNRGLYPVVPVFRVSHVDPSNNGGGHVDQAVSKGPRRSVSPVEFLERGYEVLTIHPPGEHGGYLNKTVSKVHQRSVSPVPNLQGHNPSNNREALLERGYEVLTTHPPEEHGGYLNKTMSKVHQRSVSPVPNLQGHNPSDNREALLERGYEVLTTHPPKNGAGNASRQMKPRVLHGILRNALPRLEDNFGMISMDGEFFTGTHNNNVAAVASAANLNAYSVASFPVNKSGIREESTHAFRKQKRKEPGELANTSNFVAIPAPTLLQKAKVYEQKGPQDSAQLSANNTSEMHSFDWDTNGSGLNGTLQEPHEPARHELHKGVRAPQSSGSDSLPSTVEAKHQVSRQPFAERVSAVSKSEIEGKLRLSKNKFENVKRAQRARQTDFAAVDSQMMRAMNALKAGPTNIRPSIAKKAAPSESASSYAEYQVCDEADIIPKKTGFQVSPKLMHMRPIAISAMPCRVSARSSPEAFLHIVTPRDDVHGSSIPTHVPAAVDVSAASVNDGFGGQGQDSYMPTGSEDVEDGEDDWLNGNDLSTNTDPLNFSLEEDVERLLRQQLLQVVPNVGKIRGFEKQHKDFVNSLMNIDLEQALDEGDAFAC
jgi:hypothetical protein